MQAGQVFVHAHKGKRGNEQPDDRPPRQHFTAPARHQPHMQPHRIIQPHDKRPRFFRVPAPIASPRIGRPQSAQNRGNGEKQETHGNRFIHGFLNLRRIGKKFIAVQRQQFRHAESRRHAETAVADKIGRHMQLHPPRLQRRNQRLNFTRAALNAVPNGKRHQAAHQDIHKHTQFVHGKFLLVIQIHQPRNHHEQDEHFIQVGHGNVARIGAQQIAFVPAHQQADKARKCRRPRQTAGNGK